MAETNILKQIVRIEGHVADIKEKLNSSVFDFDVTNLETSKDAIVGIQSATAATTTLGAGEAVTINKGYVKNPITITASGLGGQTDGTATPEEILAGETAWVNGSKVTGSMPNHGGETVTVSLSEGASALTGSVALDGYYKGNATASVGYGAITSGSANITSQNINYNASAGNFTVTGEATIGAPTVTTNGYVSASKGTKNTNKATLNTTMDKVELATEIVGTGTFTPTISRVAKGTGDNWTDAASGAATTTKPSTGVYVKVNSAKTTGIVSATPEVAVAGYGTTEDFDTNAASKEVGANASADTYIPITSGAHSASISGAGSFTPVISKQNTPSGVTNAAAGNATTTAPTSGIYVAVQSATQTAKTLTATSSVSKAGWIAAGDDTATANVGLTASSMTYVPIKEATISNTCASGKTDNSYTSIDSNDLVLTSGGFLYINEGYSKDVKVSLANLIPNDAKFPNGVAGLLNGTTAYDSDGNLITGTSKYLNALGAQTDNTSAVALDAEIDGLVTESIAIEAGYTAGGEVRISDSIANRLALI